MTYISQTLGRIGPPAAPAPTQRVRYTSELWPILGRYGPSFGREASHAYDAETRDVVVVAVLGCDGHAMGHGRGCDPRVVDRHRLAGVPEGEAQGGPAMGDLFVDRQRAEHRRR